MGREAGRGSNEDETQNPSAVPCLCSAVAALSPPPPRLCNKMLKMGFLFGR